MDEAYADRDRNVTGESMEPLHSVNAANINGGVLDMETPLLNVAVDATARDDDDEDPAVAAERERTLCLLRVLYFLAGISSSTWGRFSAVYYNEKGLTAQQMGILEGTMPMVSMVAAPLWGFLADRLRRKKLVALTTRVFSGGLLLLYAVPSIARDFEALLLIGVGVALFVSQGILDAYTLDVLGEKRRRQYGRIRLWCAVSWGGGAVAMGAICDRWGFDANFILYGVLNVISLVLIAWKVPDRTSAEKGLAAGGDATRPRFACADLRAALCPTPRAVFFFAEVALLGAAFALVECGLLFYYLLHLGASTFLCGLTVGVTVLLEIPIFYWSEDVLKRVSNDALFLTAMVAYAARVYGYTLLTPATVHWVLALELLHGITFACMWIAAVEYVKVLSPPAWVATGQLLLSALKGCLGGGAGAVVGGWAYTKYGGVWMYRVAALVMAAAVVMHVAAMGASWWCRSRARARGDD